MKKRSHGIDYQWGIKEYFAEEMREAPVLEPLGRDQGDSRVFP